MESIRQLADRRNYEKLPISIIVITNQDDLRSLKGVLEGKGVTGDPVGGVLYGATPLKGSKIYELKGTIKPDGSSGRSVDVEQIVKSSSGAWPISSEGLTDEKVHLAWWHIVNGNMGAYKSVVSASKKRGETGEQAATLAKRVEESLSNRFSAMTFPLSDFASYQTAEALLADMTAANIRDQKDVKKQLEGALKEAKKNQTIAAELKARDAYLRCMSMIAGTILKKRQNGVSGLRSLNEAMPDTAYGALAGRRYETYSLN